MYPITRPKWSPFLLDNISQRAESAHALRRLTVKYSDALIRVRRSSDNNEQDISFNSEGFLDTVSLLNFVGANDGFISKWYDQSSNRFPVNQAIAANQAKIVSSGTLNTSNSKPTVSFLKSSSQWLDNSNPLPVLASYAVASYTSATYLAFDGICTDTGLTISGILGESGTTRLYQLNSSFYVNGAITAVTPMSNSLFIVSQRSTVDIRQWSGVNIGKQSAYSFRTWNGNISEALNFSTYDDATRRLIEQNQGRYYGITI